MSATAQTIDRLKADGRGALIGYLPVSFPSFDESVATVRGLIDAGADIIELGIPYSDPVMDGITIQEAVNAALAGGARVRDVFRLVEAVADLGAPILAMTYFNPVLRYGVDAFARDLAAAGGAGLITPDLIPEEAGAWITAADEHHLDKVFLVAPSSTTARLASTAAASRGFVYAASTMGVTGERATVGLRAEQLVADTRAAGAERVCVGLGVSRPEQAAVVGRYADGVIVGSAFVRPLLAPGPFAVRLAAMQEIAAGLAAGVQTARSADAVAGLAE